MSSTYFNVIHLFMGTELRLKSLIFWLVKENYKLELSYQEGQWDIPI